MRAILLAAGLGMRLRPLTETVPKCLVSVEKKPLLDYWLDLLFGSGAFERVLINTHWLPDQVRQHVAGSKWAAGIDLVHEAELLGTGGTVLANREWVGQGPVLVAHADNLTIFDAVAFLERHAARPQGVDITMMTFHADDPYSCGIIETDRRGIVTAFHEKVSFPPSDLANAAVYIFEPTVIDFMAKLGKPVIDLSTEVIPHFVRHISTFPNDAYHRDIGNAQALEQARNEFPAKASKVVAHAAMQRND